MSNEEYNNGIQDWLAIIEYNDYDFEKLENKIREKYKEKK